MSCFLRKADTMSSKTSNGTFVFGYCTLRIARYVDRVIAGEPRQVCRTHPGAAAEGQRHRSCYPRVHAVHSSHEGMECLPDSQPCTAITWGTSCSQRLVRSIPREARCGVTIQMTISKSQKYYGTKHGTVDTITGIKSQKVPHQFRRHYE